MGKKPVPPAAQIILYAKGHFGSARSDTELLEDLRVLVADYVGMETKFVNTLDIIEVLYDIYCGLCENRLKGDFGLLLKKLATCVISEEKVSLTQIIGPLLNSLCLC